MSQSRAIVVGAGVAGLLAARVLTDGFDSVLVVDRDDLDYRGLPRPGVPQGRHTHLLLPGGLDAIERLLPGFAAELQARGGRRGDLQERVVMCLGPQRLASGTCSADFVSASRGMVEASLHSLVGGMPTVEIRSGTSVLDLLVGCDARQVRGVRVAARDGGPSEDLPADLVVDASGRGSRLPEWLGRRGYAVPPESTVRLDERYVTRRFQLPARHDTGALVIAQGASVDNARCGIAAHQHDDVWSVSVSGYHGDQPARDLPGFLDFARTLEAPHIARLLDDLEPTDEGASYRFVSDTRRHYERLARFPGGLLVLGDAVCSLDPVKGQGMALAALQAVVLRGVLAEGPDRLAERFFAVAAATVLADPWAMAAAGAPARPGSPRSRGPVESAFEGYLQLLVRGAVDDPYLAGRFLRTASLVEPARSLLGPRTAGRVGAGALARLSARHTGRARPDARLSTGSPPPERRQTQQDPR